MQFFTPEGKLKTLLIKRQNVRKVLEIVARRFEFDREYGFKEVNAILSDIFDDPIWLRRELVDAGLLARPRDGSVYWRPRTEVDPAPDAADTDSAIRGGETDE